MKPILLNNRIKLVNDNDIIRMSIIVPALCISEMILKTKCKVLNKKLVKLPFHHTAGDVYDVHISVRFKNIENFLQKTKCDLAENCAEYLNLLDVNDYRELYGNVRFVYTNKTQLYAFKHVYKRKIHKYDNYIYYDINNKKISVIPSEHNDFGKAKFIKFNNKTYVKKQHYE